MDNTCGVDILQSSKYLVHEELIVSVIELLMLDHSAQSNLHSLHDKINIVESVDLVLIRGYCIE